MDRRAAVARARAVRYHALRRGLGAAALRGELVCLRSLCGHPGDGAVESLRTADTAEVPGIVGRLAGYNRWARGRLTSRLARVQEGTREQVHLRLALLPSDPRQLAPLALHMLQAPAEQFPVIRESLANDAVRLAPRLWSVLARAGAARSKASRRRVAG